MGTPVDDLSLDSPEPGGPGVPSLHHMGRWRSWRWVLVLLAAFQAASAHTQLIDGQFVRETIIVPRKMVLLARPDVRDALKLTGEQYRRIREKLKPYASESNGSVLITVGPSDDLAAVERDLILTLNVRQRKRLDEIWMWVYGAATLINKELADKVGLSDAQRMSIEASLREWELELLALIRETRNGRLQLEPIQKLRVRYDAKLAAVMTSDQARTFESLKGELFRTTTQIG